MDTSRRMLLMAAAGAVLPASAGTPPPELQLALPEVRLRGEGRLRFLGLHVYDIRLWTPGDFAPERWAEAPFALEIQYARALVGKAIAERSLQEMQRQGSVPAERAQRWLTEMERVFPDVKQGDRLLGLKQPGISPSRFRARM